MPTPDLPSDHAADPRPALAAAWDAQNEPGGDLLAEAAAALDATVEVGSPPDAALALVLARLAGFVRPDTKESQNE